MKLEEATIKNFRLLTDVNIQLDDISTLIVGKNNTGKTSFTRIFEIFISGKKPSFDDFSLTTHDKFVELYQEYNQITDENKKSITEKLQEEIPKISLLLKLSFDRNDNWANIRPFDVDLSGSNQIQVLFEYAPRDTIKFLSNIDFLLKEVNSSDGYSRNEIIEAIRINADTQYQLIIRPYSETNPTDPVTLTEVSNLLQCNFIKAQRQVDDSNVEDGVKLSGVFEKHYSYRNKEKPDKASQELKQTIVDTNKGIDMNLNDFFNDFIGAFEEFGFPNINDEKVELKSKLDVEKLFRNNVKLYYNNQNNLLPEKYNGLGYSNLIYIISQILWFQNYYEDSEAAHCLIFIEEPEAHMHPQMQNVFIQRINGFLEKRNFNAQVIISTHSSHILSNAHLESIRYFTKTEGKTVVKDLMKFRPSSNGTETINFLKQYLTLGNSELFFADKAILFEGVVERLLMPIFIKKIDKAENRSLSSEYIAYIEVGNAYMQKFKELLEFLELKALIITDIDSVEKVIKKNKNGVDITTYPTCPITNSNNLVTSNSTLKKWIPNEENIIQLVQKNESDKISGIIRVAYQTNIETFPSIKCGRSFEEAFIIENSDYLFTNQSKITAISNKLSNYSNDQEVYNDSFELLDFIDRNNRKTSFAFDLLMVEQDSWVVPTYIKEGLLWLAE